jgi:hypothetical protein
MNQTSLSIIRIDGCGRCLDSGCAIDDAAGRSHRGWNAPNAEKPRCPPEFCSRGTRLRWVLDPAAAARAVRITRLNRLAPLRRTTVRRTAPSKIVL